MAPPRRHSEMKHKTTPLSTIAELSCLLKDTDENHSDKGRQRQTETNIHRQTDNGEQLGGRCRKLKDCRDDGAI